MLLLRRVVGDSMLPGLAADQLVVGLKFARPQPGDVVIVRHDGREKIKRVQNVSEGKLFLLGDNLEASTDSRHFGWLPLDAVVGRVVWPRLKRVVVTEPPALG